MRRFAFLFCWVWVSFVSSLAASQPIRYESPHTDLKYRYSMQEEGSKGELRVYRFRTERGDLQMTIFSDEESYVITSDLDDEQSGEVVTMTASRGPGDGEVELAWPDLGYDARYLKHEGSDELSRVAGRPPECELLVKGELALTKKDLLEQVRSDYARYVEPPTHLEQLLTALYVARFMPLIAAECEHPQEPTAGGCYYDSSNYIDCISCCEEFSGITTAVCMIGATRICGGACLRLMAGVCGGAVEFGSGICKAHNCRGLPGDPGCNQDAPCDGTCMSFCGPGWDSSCGHCEGGDGNLRACCK